MSSAVRIGALVMLIPGAVFTGVIVAYAVERISLWSRMPIEQFAVDFRRSLARADPLQPILLVVSTSGATTFALNASGTARDLAWLGIALLLSVLIGSIAIAEPMNSRFRRLPEGSVPPGAEQLRAAWARFHLIRTGIALAAFSCFVLAVTYV